MPITVGTDPNNPGAFIWVDSRTGEPAVHLNGDPNAPFVAPSDLRAVQDEHVPKTDISANPSQTPSPGGVTVASQPPTHGVPPSIQKAVDSLSLGGQKWHVVGDGTPIEETETKQVASDDPLHPGTVTKTVGTGSYYVNIQGDDGTQRAMLIKATPPNGTKLPQTGVTDLPTVDKNTVFQGDLSSLDWSQAGPVKDVSQATPQTEIDATVKKAQAEADTARNNADMITQQRLEKEHNQATSGYYVTNAELQTLKNDQTQLQIASDKNKNDQVTNQIAEERAVNEKSKADGDLKIAQEQVDVANHQLDETVWKDHVDAEIAKQNADTSRMNANISALQQQATAQRQTEQTAVETAQNVETARSNKAREEQAKAELAQRVSEQQTTAETARETAATQAAATGVSSALDFTRQNAATGAGLEQARASTVANMLGSVLGLGGKLGPVAPAAGTGELLAQGIQSAATQALGGQATLDTAARLVQQADPTSNMFSPMAQQAVGVLTQMLDRYHQLTGGQLHPAEQNVANANAAGASSLASNGVTAPPMSNPPGPSYQTAAPTTINPIRPAMPAVPGLNQPTGPNLNPVPGNLNTSMNQPASNALASGAMTNFTAPVTAPPQAALANFPMSNFTAPPMAQPAPVTINVSR